MKILSIGKEVHHDGLNIVSISFSSLSEHNNIEEYKYIIINGGDGSIRRVVNELRNLNNIPIFILNSTGSFNVLSKIHKTPKLNIILDSLANEKILKTNKHNILKLNDQIFLFSAGNMGDLQHILLSETLRFGIFKHGILKYILSILFIFPMHLIMTPIMLMSKNKFFIFTPAHFIKKFGSFYGEISKEINIDLDNEYNILELDGDIVIIKDRYIKINKIGHIDIAFM